MDQVSYHTLQLNDLPEVKAFTDKWIGDNYYSLEDLEHILLFSALGGQCASLVAKVGKELAGVRLSYAPGVWCDVTVRGLSPNLWKVHPRRVAYFKSLFISNKFQQLGIGKNLSFKSLELLSEMGAKAVLCHSWVQSPGNSSQIYLKKMGFEAVKEHLKFWYPVDYMCPVCAPERCLCTGLEMIKYL